jgi:tRNA A37 threonylcarbamoyladenosine synthetase subunit TsaC/SUA5/YrdC
VTDGANIVGALDDPRARDVAREALHRGGVVVLPTDTLYGFSAKLSAEGAVNRISAIKHASTERRYILLASSIAMVDRVALARAALGDRTQRRLAAGVGGTDRGRARARARVVASLDR